MSLLLLDRLTGFIAPHQCLGCGEEGAVLCPSCVQLLPDVAPNCFRCGRPNKDSHTCPACISHAPLERVWVRTQLEAFGREVIHGLKFGRKLAATNTIALALTQQFGRYLPNEALLVPVPTATSRVRQRGYDQSVMIAKALSRQTGLPCLQILERYGQQRQTGSSRAQRLKQLENVFHVRNNKLPNIDNLVLVDDVLTTGATLETAANILKATGVKRIDAIVFGRAE